MTREHDQLLKKFMSHDVMERIVAGQDLYALMRDNLLQHLYYKTKNWQQAEDLVQHTFLRMDNALREGPLSSDRNPKAYLYQIAMNLFRDWYRRNKLEPEKIAQLSTQEGRHRNKRNRTVSRNLEEQLEEEWLCKNARHVLAHIPREEDRVIALWQHLLQFEPMQIHSLTGWNLHEIRKGGRRISRYLRKMKQYMEEEGQGLDRWKEIEQKPGPWEKKMAFTGGQKPICVTRLNVFPTNIHLDSLALLLRDLDMASLDQIWDNYVVLLRTEESDLTPLTCCLTFMPRKYFSREVFYEGKTIRYVDYLPSFERVRANGSWQEVMTLEKIVEYPGKIVGPEVIGGELVGIIYEFPTLGIRARKAFTEKLVKYTRTPNSREPVTYVYQLYPLANGSVRA